MNINSLPRILCRKEKINNQRCLIDDQKDIFKIRNVLRLKNGSNLRIFDGEKNEYVCKLINLSKSGIEAEIIERIVEEKKERKEDNVTIILAQALTRSSKIEEIIKMNTEIGVSEFIFFESDHSIVKLKDIKPTKIDRWQKIAEEATRQSEQLILPKINAPTKFRDLGNIEADHKLLLHARETDVSVLLHNLKYESSSSILVVIGPEGGFSDRELEFAGKNFEILHLNLPILRTETAGVVVCSYILIENKKRS